MKGAVERKRLSRRSLKSGLQTSPSVSAEPITKSYRSMNG
jgi:hypothetical protein